MAADPTLDLELEVGTWVSLGWEEGDRMWLCLVCLSIGD